MTTYPVEQTATAVADANGRAEVRIGPMRSFETWNITNTGVQATGTNTPRFKAYRGAETPQRFIEGTYAGNQDNSNTAYTVRNGEPLVGVWTGADPGATCTLTLSGMGNR